MSYRATTTTLPILCIGHYRKRMKNNDIMSFYSFGVKYLLVQMKFDSGTTKQSQGEIQMTTAAAVEIKTVGWIRTLEDEI